MCWSRAGGQFDGTAHHSLSSRFSLTPISSLVPPRSPPGIEPAVRTPDGPYSRMQAGSQIEASGPCEFQPNVHGLPLFCTYALAGTPRVGARTGPKGRAEGCRTAGRGEVRPISYLHEYIDGAALRTIRRHVSSRLTAAHPAN
jgi:hypothetical protein